MKIDFNAGYSSIEKLIFRKDFPDTNNKLKSDFNETLGKAARLNPQAVEKLTIDKSLTASETPKIPVNFTESMNQFPDSIPSMQIPKVEERQTLPNDELVELEDGTGVKVPTLVRAGRINLSDEYEVKSDKAERIAEFKGIIETAGSKLGIDPALGMAVAHAESSFNHLAVSSDGHYSKGLFQLLDQTGKLMMERLKKSEQYDPFNPELNVELGVGYLRYLHEIFSTDTALPNNSSTVKVADSASLEKIAVAAFNAGEGRVASAQERAKRAGKDASQYDQIAEYLPEITQKYVEKVSSLRAQSSLEDISNNQG